MKRLNPQWEINIGIAIDEAMAGKTVFTRTLSEPLAKASLISTLSRRGIPFIAKNLGAGVMTITTDTATCPLCKQKLVKNSEIWKNLATDALLVLQAFSVGHSTQLAIEKQLAREEP